MAVTHGMSLPACRYQLSDCRDPRKVTYFLFEEGKNPKSHQFKQSPPKGWVAGPGVREWPPAQVWVALGNMEQSAWDE